MCNRHSCSCFFLLFSVGLTSADTHTHNSSIDIVTSTSYCASIFMLENSEFEGRAGLLGRIVYETGAMPAED
jgi:hypothetical protein